MSQKPTSKSQYEISTSGIDPYDTTRGNPNQSRELNRGEKASYRDDNVKPFSVGIKDIDESIVYYFDHIVQPSVIQNGQRIKVPLIYGAPERWKSVQRDGYYKDQKGKIMAPLIMFKRNTITPIRGLYNKMDANYPNNIAYFEKKYTKVNSYDRFDLLNNRIPIKEYHAVVVPDYVTVQYSCVAYTYYIEQLNKIIEALNYASNSYWGNPNRFKFRAMIDSFSTITELNKGQERTAKANFDLTLTGYIIPDIIQKDLAVDKKRFSKGQINITTETTTNDLP